MGCECPVTGADFPASPHQIPLSPSCSVPSNLYPWGAPSASTPGAETTGMRTSEWGLCPAPRPCWEPWGAPRWEPPVPPSPPANTFGDGHPWHRAALWGCFYSSRAGAALGGLAAGRPHRRSRSPCHGTAGLRGVTAAICHNHVSFAGRLSCAKLSDAARNVRMFVSFFFFSFPVCFCVP